ncbi:MAG: anthranilate synthase component I [Lachnospiraceae bacterium]|nr:anthranilate synthase component I [Lachnospiraceae bacterium]
MYTPVYEEALQFAESGKYKVIPIKKEIYSDMRTPIEVLRKLKKFSGHCYLLESAEDNKKWGRYTFLGFRPVLDLTCVNGKMTIKRKTSDSEAEDEVQNILTKHPGRYIQQIIDENKSPKLEGFPPFTGGLVGYFSYDYIKYSEPSLNLDAEDQEEFNDVDLMLFNDVIAFDNFRQKIIIITNVKTENFRWEYEQGMERIEMISRIISEGALAEIKPAHVTSEFRKLFDKTEFCEMVERAKHYITEGDIFQVVLSNRLEADFEGSLLDVYRVLRTLNPSPYMFYFTGNDIEIAGASPETLVKLQDGTLHTFPLAGTRKRGETEKEDKRLEEELLSDEKERAEHNMLVDLGRNDLGKISRFGSVEVEKYMSVERYSHVMHIGSTVKGEIRDDKSAVHAIDAVLPAGTLSGAPKIRACEIINELENNKRGIYGGAIGYLDFTGNLDVCIAIRIAFKKNGRVFVRSGAGIVADSVPENEFEECINKAKAVMKAIETAEGGIE